MSAAKRNPSDANARFLAPLEMTAFSFALHQSRRRNFAVEIPQIFPILVGFPEKDLALDQPAVLVDACDLGHLFVVSGGLTVERRLAR
jgi:hypothetical protein